MIVQKILHRKWKKETVDEGHMDEPNDVSISSDDDDEVYACSNKHGTHKPSRIYLNPMAAEFWPSSLSRRHQDLC
jgi:hypothetical protein